MDKFWRRSREELLIDMEGLSYVDRLKSLSPFSLERRRRRLRGIFAVCEHLKGDHKDSGQDLLRLSSNRKQPPETPGSVPPTPRSRWVWPDSSAGDLRGPRGTETPTLGVPLPHSRLRACASNCDRFCRVASLTSTLSPLRILPGRSSRSLWTEFSEATTTSAYLWESPAVSQQEPAPSGASPARGQGPPAKPHGAPSGLAGRDHPAPPQLNPAWCYMAPSSLSHTVWESPLYHPSSRQALHHPCQPGKALAAPSLPPPPAQRMWP